MTGKLWASLLHNMQNSTRSLLWVKLASVVKAGVRTCLGCLVSHHGYITPNPSGVRLLHVILQCLMQLGTHGALTAETLCKGLKRYYAPLSNCQHSLLVLGHMTDKWSSLSAMCGDWLKLAVVWYCSDSRFECLLTEQREFVVCVLENSSSLLI